MQNKMNMPRIFAFAQNTPCPFVSEEHACDRAERITTNEVINECKQSLIEATKRITPQLAVKLAPLAEQVSTQPASRPTPQRRDGDPFRRLRMNDALNLGSQLPEIKPLWKNLWFEGELCVLFAASNMGKSTYAMQIANDIAGHGHRVAYYDFELSAEQQYRRYRDAAGHFKRFSDALVRYDIDPEEGIKPELREILKCMEQHIDDHHYDTIVVDNITWLETNTQCAESAGFLVKALIELKRKKKVSMLILAHTPKRDRATPIDLDSLAGSSLLGNFIDSAFAIGASGHCDEGRYIKQIKVRSDAKLYGENNVILTHIAKDGTELGFVEDGFSTEDQALDAKYWRQAHRASKIEAALEERRKHPERSNREIAASLGIPESTLRRELAKLEKDSGEEPVRNLNLHLNF